jgi:hypothetical protein
MELLASFAAVTADSLAWLVNRGISCDALSRDAKVLVVRNRMAKIEIALEAMVASERHKICCCDGI